MRFCTFCYGVVVYLHYPFPRDKPTSGLRLPSHTFCSANRLLTALASYSDRSTRSLDKIDELRATLLTKPMYILSHESSDISAFSYIEALLEECVQVPCRYDDPATNSRTFIQREYVRLLFSNLVDHHTNGVRGSDS